MTQFSPQTTLDVADIVASAASSHQTLEITAGGSKNSLGRPVFADHKISLSQLSGILEYEPAELVLTAHAATPLAYIEAQLAENNQMLAFEVPDWQGLLRDGGASTLGGALACNVAGARRVRAGAARDHFLGFVAVNGRGEAWKAGGKVVKNVTGYDICKLQAGAYGTLSILTQVTIRVVPKPETSCSLVLHDLSDSAAIQLLADALNSPHEVSGAAHLPRHAATGEPSRTILRLEGHAPSVSFRAKALQIMWAGAQLLDEKPSRELWTKINAVEPQLAQAGTYIWRLFPTPSTAASVVAAITERHPSAQAFYDWGGGQVWLSLDPTEAGSDAGAGVVRAALANGGAATLFRAPAHVREAIAVFQPSPPPLEALTKRVKTSFDPLNILNPGRMQKAILSNANSF